jgi:hypothetical protein
MKNIKSNQPASQRTRLAAALLPVQDVKNQDTVLGSLTVNHWIHSMELMAQLLRLVSLVVDEDDDATRVATLIDDRGDASAKWRRYPKMGGGRVGAFALDVYQRARYMQ